MTKICYCKNCKHLGLDGMFGLFCDVNGNNKNYDCPKYVEKELKEMTGKKQQNKTVKIDRFQIKADGKYVEKDIVSIVDYLEYRTIIDFRTNDKQLNMELAEIVLNELNQREWVDKKELK